MSIDRHYTQSYNTFFSDVINPKGKPSENTNKPVPPKITSPIKLVTELYKTHGIRSLYRGGTLLMIRSK